MKKSDEHFVWITAYDLPFAYDVEYNKETTQHKAGYFSNESELTKLLTNYEKKKLNIIASDMKIIAKKEYNWKVISMKYKKILN